MDQSKVVWQPLLPKTPWSVIAERPLRTSGFGFASDLGLRVSDWKNASLRWFSDPSVHDYLHITIGTPEEAVALLKAAKAVL